VIKEDGLGIVGPEVCRKCPCEEDERGKKRIGRKVCWSSSFGFQHTALKYWQ
jgi:hypothetical protein